MKRAGLTLIEVLIAVMLIGVAIASLITANIAFTKSNGVGVDMSIAEFLIEEIRELTTLLPVVDPQTATSVFGPEAGETTVSAYDDIDDFDGAVFSPPIDIGRQQLTELSGFSQRITVQNVQAGNFSQVAADHGSDFVKVTVEILVKSQVVSAASWLRARTD